MDRSPNTDTDVLIVGAGCAGLAAGVRLVSRDRTSVVVVEEGPRLGGRASAFSDPKTGERLDNGQHALFGCYYETYEFLRTIGMVGSAPLEPALRVMMADTTGRAAPLACPAGIPAPWHLVAGLLRWSAVPLSDRLAAFRLGGVLWKARRAGGARAAETVPAEMTVAQWLSAQGQPASLCQWLWHPLALAALNQSAEVAAARPFVRVVAELFGGPAAAAALGIPLVPLDDLYAEPAARLIESRGGVVLRGSGARLEYHPTEGGTGPWRVWVGSREFRPKVVISSVPWHAFSRLWSGDVPAPIRPVADAAARMASSPIVTVNLWFGRQVLPERQVGLVGTEFHWAFQKAGGRVSLVASGADHLLRRSNESLAALAEDELRSVTGSGMPRRERALVIREARATFSLAPGRSERPGTSTSLPGFLLAGDWTDTGLPGTIEGAVLSGHRAADAAMKRL